MNRRPVTRLHRFAFTAYVAVAVLPALILVVFLVGSLILSGGQVSPTMDTKWDAVVAYPLFPVPTPLLVGLAIASVALVVLVVATAWPGDLPGLRGLIGPTVSAIIAAVLLSGLVPDEGRRYGDVVWGGQWVAGLISLAALVVLLAAIAFIHSRNPSARSV
ncbi:hypothetical protein K0817_000805 [Microbacterium sp. HD4P20]|uniref:hypothetical protein n=1 Tax=Microbacterium sp. HD4P20 TaxID=2864874 RepID=UPI001C6445BB|nr:hypothetical protein [Microbacterium sp. HD4P20]MCP2635103.1 hypothetical protein [Microbacterium sp. HD4P20]